MLLKIPLSTLIPDRGRLVGNASNVGLNPCDDVWPEMVVVQAEGRRGDINNIYRKNKELSAGEGIFSGFEYVADGLTPLYLLNL